MQQSAGTGAEAATSAPATAPRHSVDSHFSWLRTRLAAESTIMSWNRTSLSLIGFGFTIYQFFEKFQTATVGADALRPEAPRTLGLALILTGTLGTLIAMWQYHRLVAYLGSEPFREISSLEGLPHWSLTFAVTGILLVIGIVTSVWVLVRG
jgi:inner membrane protein YidH